MASVMDSGVSKLKFTRMELRPVFPSGKNEFPGT